MIKPGSAATYAGVYEIDFLRPGMYVFVRAVDTDAATAYVQNPYDSHERMTVDLADLSEVVR